MLDWKIQLAQAVNFLVLVWFLAKYLYRPIVKAMNDREQRIATSITEAREHAEKAKKEAELFASKNQDFDRERENMLNKMREEIETMRKSMSAESRTEIETMRKKWKEEFDREKSSLETDIKRITAKQFSDFSAKVLKDLSGETLEKSVVAKFINKLEKLSDQEKTIMAKAIEASNKISLRSSYTLSSDVKEKITAIINSITGKKDLKVEVKVEENLACGIELDAGSWSVMWSLDSYVERFAEELNTKLDELASGAVKSAA